MISRHTTLRWTRALRFAATCCVFLFGLWACDGPEKTETERFEEAEVYYRQGHYETALDGYTSFLEEYPDSPLAEVAELRIRTINREVSSMLGRSDAPRPVYTGSGQKRLDANDSTSSEDHDNSAPRIGESRGEADE